MQRSLDEVMASGESLPLITLECGHIFTTETLDGTMGLNDYYEMDSSGHWCGLKTPVDFQARRNCPTCRGPVTASRYSRVTKRSLLDLQELVTVKLLSEHLDRLRERAGGTDIPHRLEPVVLAIQKIGVPKPRRCDTGKITTLLSSLSDDDVKCVHPSAFDLSAFGIHGSVTGAWDQLTADTFCVYRGLCNIANQKRTPHVMAYEAAVTDQYRRELAISATSRSAISQDASQDTRHSNALRLARRRMGAPPPQGTMMLKLDALNLSLTVRWKLGSLALAFAEKLGNLDHSPQFERKLRHGRPMGKRFGALGLAFLRSTVRDACLSIRLARETTLLRHETRAHALHLQARLRLAREEASVEIAQASNRSAAEIRDCRVTVSSRLKVTRKELHDEITAAFKGILTSRSQSLDDFVKSMEISIQDFLSDFDNYIEHVAGTDTFQPVTAQEKADIVRAILGGEGRGKV